MTKLIEHRIEKLQQIFKEAQALAEVETSLPILVEQIETFSKDFISIAYEAVSMELAMKGLRAEEGLGLWADFLKNYAQKHAVQAHVGLGWALAQQRLAATEYLNDLEPFLAWRILDGYGYYDGFFRRRKVMQGVLPDDIKGSALEVYAQGVGRSLWYLSKGNLDKLSELLAALPQTWLKDLWRGVGIASTYVGGGDLQHWQNLWQHAAAFQPQLAAGAALAVKSRVDADTSDATIDNNSLLWTGLKPQEIVDLLQQKMKEVATLTDNEKYHAWIAAIDNSF